MTVTLRYSPSILRQAIGYYIRKVYLKKLVGLSIAAILLITFSFALIDSPWMLAFSVVPAVMIPTMLVLGYWLRIRESLKRLSMLDNGEVIMTLTETGTVAASALGKSEANWKIYSDLWEFPSTYLLLYMGHQFITLPKDQVTPEFIAFIKSKLPVISKGN